MIATHNIKVNGQWIRPGETYEDPIAKPVRKKEEPKEEKITEETVIFEEEKPKAEPKPRSTSRRKITK